MFHYLQRFVTYILDFIKWGLVPSNRKMAFQYFRLGLSLSRKAAGLTRTKKDDAGVEFIARMFEEVSSSMDDAQREAFAELVTKDSKELSDLEIKASPSSPARVSVGPVSGTFDTKTKKFGVELLGFKLI